MVKRKFNIVSNIFSKNKFFLPKSHNIAIINTVPTISPPFRTISRLGFQGASRQSSISIINNFLFVDIVKQKLKNFTDFIQKFHGFSKFSENQTLLEANFFNFDHKPFLRSCEVPQKFGLDRFSRFDVYWIQTNRQVKHLY